MTESLITRSLRFSMALRKSKKIASSGKSTFTAENCQREHLSFIPKNGWILQILFGLQRLGEVNDFGLGELSPFRVSSGEEEPTHKQAGS